MDKMIPVKEAAKFLGIREDALRNRVYNKTVPFRKIAGRLYFDPAQLQSWKFRDTKKAICNTSVGYVGEMATGMVAKADIYDRVPESIKRIIVRDFFESMI